MVANSHRLCLEYIREDDKLKYINKYGFLMSNKYSQEILKYYNDFVSELAEYACNRYRYNKLTSYLTRMSKYPNGKELVQQLSSEWINKYPTRKVMVEELERYSCNE